MKRFCALVILFISVQLSFGQCQYTLKMNDSYGDGWNGFSIDLFVDGAIVLQNQTLDSGFENFVVFDVSHDQEITTVVNSNGIYDDEVSYQILDIFDAVQSTGTAFNDITSGEVITLCPQTADAATEIVDLPLLDLDVETESATIALSWFDNSCGLDIVEHVLYKFSPTSDLTLGIDITHGDADSRIHIFQANSLNIVDYNDLMPVFGNDCANATSKNYPLTANTNYYILVSNPNSDTHISFYDVSIDSELISFPDVNLRNKLLNDDSVQFVHDINTFRLSITATHDIDEGLTFGALPRFNIDTNNDGEIQKREVLHVQWLNLSSANIQSLDGLQEFVNLKALDFWDNLVSDISWIQNLDLEVLDCSLNNFTTLDFSNNLELVTIKCYNENLTSFDITQNINLKVFEPSRSSDLPDEFFVNGFSEFDVSANINLVELAIGGTTLSSLDLSNNINLERLYVNNNNNLSSLDLSSNTALRSLRCLQNSSLQDLDLSQNSNITFLVCRENPITSIDVSNLPNLGPFQFSDSLITELDLSNNPDLDVAFIQRNPFLEFVNLKNGNNTELGSIAAFSCFNLQTICVDDVAYAISNYPNISPQTIFVEDCSSTTVDYNLISGVVTFDDEGDGCDSEDLPVSGIMVMTTDGTDEFATFTQEDGSYLLDVLDTSYTTTVVLPDYLDSGPADAVTVFSNFGNTDTQNFCLTTNQSFQDLEVTYVNLNEARPGFIANYQLIFSNNGPNTISNGSVVLEYDNTKLQFNDANQTVASSTFNTLTFNYLDLLPLETRAIDISFIAFTPPTVESGDILNFIASINPIIDDLGLIDNTFEFSQEVVNSYDPNDIRVMQGESIFVEQIDENLDYIIRFQNTGTASAINVVITQILDFDLDTSSFRPMSSSHDYRVEMTNGRQVEFIFENINLPDSTNDEENSIGFITYKIKPKSDSDIGDIFSGRANIYFDFNPPIITNTATTEIVEQLSIEEFEINKLQIYPIPTDNTLNIVSSINFNKVSIYDFNGRLLRSDSMNTTYYKMDVSELSSGIYFVEVLGNSGKILKKVIID